MSEDVHQRGDSIESQIPKDESTLRMDLFLMPGVFDLNLREDNFEPQNADHVNLQNIDRVESPKTDNVES